MMLEPMSKGKDLSYLKKSGSQIVIKPSKPANMRLKSVFDAERVSISSVSNLFEHYSTVESQINENSYQK